MIWNKQNHDRAVALVRKCGAVGAASMMGISPGALREHLRRAGSPVSEIVAEARLEDASDRAERRTPMQPRSGYRFERNDDAKVYVVVSDVHVPYQDRSACDAVGALMSELRPNGLVINGDYLDLLEVSRHSSGAVAQLEGLRISKSFDEGRAQLDRWMKAGGPQMTDNKFIDGNHEHRLDRWMSSGDNAVWLGDEATNIGKRLGLAERGFVYASGYPKAHAKLGHLLVTHGRWCNKYAAATHLDRYGHAIMVGHVHTPQMFYGSALGKQKAGYVNGHLADVGSPAMSYAPVPNSWCQGFSVVTVEPNKTFHVAQVQFADGAFYYGGRRYGRGAKR